MAGSVLHQGEKMSSSRNLWGWHSAPVLSPGRAIRSIPRHGRHLLRVPARAGVVRQRGVLSRCPWQVLECGGPVKTPRDHRHRERALYDLRRPGVRPPMVPSTSQQSSASATHFMLRLILCRLAFPATANHPGGQVSRAHSRVYPVPLNPALTESRPTLQAWTM